MSQVKKIAVYGSCFSRNFLSSAPYFNPTYKSYFKCVCTQFHAPFVPIQQDKIETDTSFSKKKKQFVKESSEKIFFKNMRKTTPDYLLIDLYADALKSVSFVSGKIMEISPSSKMSVIQRNLRSDYQQVWRAKLCEYKSRLIDDMEEEQIILNRCQLTKTYYDLNREIMSYSATETIDRCNQFWDELNSIFMQVFPRSKVLDMRESGYIGDISYPFGHAVSHYESAYYQHMMVRLKQLTK
ncbi:hypothetical protein HB852_01165 [Listeria grandensis]|uniref:DUF6270 domain-containing protein n=1 Tax=Listeria grandensis TaxID=1494963 RepID=UPI00162938DA|nr:DUF6270 domain-containing protein [Listeria grandensis]MBC1473226.1 hypothetical protein [Listeria grandensis]